MRYLSVCSGIEAASVAWHDLGFTPVAFSEIEPFPCELLRQRYPQVPNFGDLNGYNEWPLAVGDVDIICGGPPCQAFSVAGLREGMADPRGNLSLLYFGLVAKLRPKWIVYENVPGLLSSRSGSDFSALLSALAECGYGFAYRMLDASHFGLAQRRKRIFIVGCRTGDWRHPTAVLFDGPSSFGNPPKGEKKGKATAPATGASTGSPSRINCQPNGISGTVTNKWHKGSGGPARDEHYNQVVGSAEGRIQLPFGTKTNPDVANCLETTSNDYSRSDGFNMVVDHISSMLPVIADRASFNQGENALYDPFIGHTDTCPTLVAKGPHAVQPPIAFKVRCGGEYTGAKGGDVKPTERGGTGMLAYEDKTFTIASTQDQFVATPQQLLYENHPNDSRVTGPHEVAPTIAARFGTGGGNVPLGQAADAVTFQPGNLRRDAGADPSTEATTTLKASMGDQMPHIATPMAVRRLLPSECEALQGFQKNWTQISWRGKPVEQCPDGPRYKAIGNSMATNVMKWIGQRIKMVDEIITSLPNPPNA